MRPYALARRKTWADSFSRGREWLTWALRSPSAVRRAGRREAQAQTHDPFTQREIDATCGCDEEDDACDGC